MGSALCAATWFESHTLGYLTFEFGCLRMVMSCALVVVGCCLLHVFLANMLGQLHVLVCAVPCLPLFALFVLPKGYVCARRSAVA